MFDHLLKKLCIKEEEFRIKVKEEENDINTLLYNYYTNFRSFICRLSNYGIIDVKSLEFSYYTKAVMLYTEIKYKYPDMDVIDITEIGHC